MGGSVYFGGRTSERLKTVAAWPTTPAYVVESRIECGRDPWKNPPDGEIVALFKQVPQGAVVPIHYNPEDAAEAYIFIGLPFWKLYTGNVVAFCFGALVSLFGLLPMLLSRRVAKPSPAGGSVEP